MIKFHLNIKKKKTFSEHVFTQHKLSKTVPVLPSTACARDTYRITLCRNVNDAVPDLLIYLPFLN